MKTRFSSRPIRAVNLSIAFSVPIFAQQKGAVDLKHSTDSRGALTKV
jgi:hypothetical protein